MENNATFESAEQMAGWLWAGGRIGWIMKPQMSYSTDSAKLELFKQHYPIGDLPDDWCPFQDKIDEMEEFYIADKKNKEAIAWASALSSARAALLKSIDPRLKGDRNE